MSRCFSSRWRRTLVVAAVALLVALVGTRFLTNRAVLKSLPDGVVSRLAVWLPSDAAVQLEAGRRARAAGRLKEAEAAFDTAAELLPTDPEAQALKALVLADRGRFAFAEMALTEASQLSPDHPLVGVFEARRSLETLGPPAALRRLQQVLADHPETAEAWYVQGQAYFRIHNTRAAVDSLVRATRLHPGMAAYHRELAQAYQAVGALSLAESEAATALRLSPGDPAAQLVLGRVMLDRDPDSAALERAARLLDTSAGSLVAPTERQIALRELGRAESLRSRWQQAAAALERAISLDPDDPGTLYYLARAYRAKGDPRHAAVLARFRRAEAVQREERFLRGAVKEAPTALPPRQRLAQFYLRHGRRDDAEAVEADYRRMQSEPSVASLQFHPRPLSSLAGDAGVSRR